MITAPLSEFPALYRYDRVPGSVDPDVDDWKDRALCAETDPALFFPETGESPRPAQRVCARCDVRPQCLGYALAEDERFGVWGGLSERQRRRLRRAAA